MVASRKVSVKPKRKADAKAKDNGNAIFNGDVNITRELKEMLLSELRLDPIVNRTLDEKWAATLAAQWNELALGLFSVWYDEEEDVYKIVDGQHRYFAAEEREYNGPVACYIYKGLTIATAAELFLAINSQRNVSAIDKFLKSVQAGRKEEVAVAKVLDEYGLRVGVAEKNVGSPTALIQIYRTGGTELLDSIVGMLIEAFSDMSKAQALHGELLSGVLYIIKQYGRVRIGGEQVYRVDLAVLGKKLSEVSMIELFQDRDMAQRMDPRYSKRWHMGAILVKTYNKGEKRSDQLEQWAHRVA